MALSAANILVVEDEPAIADVVALYLQREGWAVRIARDGRSALQAIADNCPDFAILDLNLPHVHGLEILRQLRQQKQYVLVIILTDQNQEADRIRGLELGADDYVSKPFSTAELVSRVKAILRRARGKQQQGERLLRFPDLTIDPITRLVQVKGKEVALTAVEFDILYFLARHPHQIFTREQLLDRIWSHQKNVEPDTVYVHMRRLRQKIEPNPKKPRWLHTVWGTGYKFDSEEFT